MTAKAMTMISTVLALILLPTIAQAYSVVWMDPEFHYAYSPVTGDIQAYGGTVKYDAGLGAWKGYATPGFNPQNPSQSGAYWADFYCIDINTPMFGHGHEWSVYPTDQVPTSALAPGLTEWGLGWAANLYNTHAWSLFNRNDEQSQLQRTALHLAIYEAVYDGAAGYAWDLHDGSFKVLDLPNIEYFHNAYNAFQVFGSMDEFLTAYVAPYLNGYQSQDVGGYWNDGQDLLGPSPVPEPASLLLLGLGLAGSGLVIRMRKR